MCLCRFCKKKNNCYGINGAGPDIAKYETKGLYNPFDMRFPVKHVSSSEGKGGAIKNRWQGSGLMLCLLPFQMPARLAVGLGVESALFHTTHGNAPHKTVPPYPFKEWISAAICLTLLLIK
jgi:hypothetical protein